MRLAEMFGFTFAVSCLMAAVETFEKTPCLKSTFFYFNIKHQKLKGIALKLINVYKIDYILRFYKKIEYFYFYV